MVRESEFKSEDRGFDPLAGQGTSPFFCPSESTLVHIFFVPEPPSWVRHASECVRTLKNPAMGSNSGSLDLNSERSNH